MTLDENDLNVIWMVPRLCQNDVCQNGVDQLAMHVKVLFDGGPSATKPAVEIFGLNAY